MALVWIVVGLGLLGLATVTVTWAHFAAQLWMFAFVQWWRQRKGQ